VLPFTLAGYVFKLGGQAVVDKIHLCDS